MNVESRKKTLKLMFGPVVDKLGYKFSPDEDLVNFILEQEVGIETKKGAPFCPCQALTNEREHDMKLVCPCIPFHRKHYDAMRRCWCGLFVHKDVTDPDSLPQIPESEINKKIKIK